MKKEPRIVALVLAAGRSFRAGFFKPLASLGNSTFIEEAVTRFQRAGISDARVVVGHRADELTPVLDRLGARAVFNEEYGLGMFSSVLAGVRSLESGVDGFFILPADIPLVKPETIRALRAAFDPDHPGIVYPRFSRRRGHPPLIPAAFFQQDLPPDRPGGLRDFLAGFENGAADVDVLDENILLDCDTPLDYEAVLDRWSNGDIPTEAECMAVLYKLEVDGDTAAHSMVVSELSRMLAVNLNQAGLSLNIPLAVAAGLLHDIARDKPDHAAVGEKLLSRMGYPRVGSVVATHMNVRTGGPRLDEADLLYLADKSVEDDRLVSLEERFQKTRSRYGNRPDILEKISGRLEDAKSIARRIEDVIETPVDDLIRRYAGSIRAAALGGKRTIYLLRHAATRSPGSPKRFTGQEDVSLTAVGLRQAGELAQALKDLPVTAVFCSDLQRSAATAKVIAEQHRVPCIPVRELREVSLGEWDGLNFDEVRERHPEDFAARRADIVHFRPPGGESFLECSRRVTPAFYEILRSTWGNIVIVGHAGVNRVILSHIQRRSLEDLFEVRQRYGCLNVLDYRFPRLEIKLLNGSLDDLKSLDPQPGGEPAGTGSA